MANLAIKGHATRGKEVIEILEMLGGKNIYNLTGTKEIWYILSDSTIEHSAYLFDEKGFTLEEFLEKFPYKIGDKVYYDNKVCDVIEMLWNSNLNTISYGIYDGKIKNLAIVKELKPYKEETMEERKYSDLRMPLDDDDKLATVITIDGNKILPPNGYLIGKITQVDNGMLVEYVKQQPKYPKTYEECCDVLGIGTLDNDAQGHKADLIIRFQELLIARDAYWKIAGKQMGLGKSWEPDWLNAELDKYVLFTHNNAICSNRYVLGHNILAFPTAEMRDAFYENFKELIEQCKELL